MTPTEERLQLRAEAKKILLDLYSSCGHSAQLLNDVLMKEVGITIDVTKSIPANINVMRKSDLQALCAIHSATLPVENAVPLSTQQTKDEETMAKSKVTAAVDTAIMEMASVSFKPEYLNGINSLLALGTDQKITDITQLSSALAKMAHDFTEAQAELEQARMSATKFEVKEYEVKTNLETSDIPAGKFKTDLAKNIFLKPDGSKSDSLNFEVPVFDWAHDHPEVPILDPNYIFNPESLATFLYALVTNKNTWLHGHTGTGKTTFVEQVAARLKWPVIRVNLDNDIERSDFLGQTQLVTSAAGTTESRFVEGVLPRAMQSPCIFLIDEMDFGKSGIMYVLQRALEAKGLLMTEEGGKLIQPHPLFRIAATANTRGQGDELGCYPGARTQSNALLDRFTVWINVDYMSERDEQRLLEAAFPGIDTSFTSQLVTFAKEIRKAFLNRELLQSISPRSLLSICEARAFFSNVTDKEKATKLAIKTSYLQRATEDTVIKVNEIAQRCFSGTKASSTTSGATASGA
jgi:cobaltochelatase CobS subunit